MFKNKQKIAKRLRPPSSLEADRKSIFSYHASRVPGKSDNASRRSDPFAPSKPATIAWWKQLPIYFAGLAILVCLVDVMLLSTNPRVVALTSSSSQVFLHPLVQYQQAAQRLFASSLLNRDKLTINTSGISWELKQQFPELANVSVALPLIGHRPVIYIEPEKPALILASQGGGTFIISNTGKALITTTAVIKPESFNLPVVVDQSGLAVQQGKATLPSANVSFIQTVWQQLKAQQSEPSALILPANGSEFDVHLSGQNYIIKFNLEGEVNQQVGTYKAVKNYLMSHNITPTQYIDVRVPGRAYYR